MSANWKPKGGGGCHRAPRCQQSGAMRNSDQSSPLQPQRQLQWPRSPTGTHSHWQGPPWGRGHPRGVWGHLLQPKRTQEEELCILETEDLAGNPWLPQDHHEEQIHFCNIPKTIQHPKSCVLPTLHGREGVQPPTAAQTDLLPSSCCSRSATSSPPAARTWPLCACP